MKQTQFLILNVLNSYYCYKYVFYLSPFKISHAQAIKGFHATDKATKIEILS
jgi:hypothetical protein